MVIVAGREGGLRHGGVLEHGGGVVYLIPAARLLQSVRFVVAQ